VNTFLKHSLGSETACASRLAPLLREIWVKLRDQAVKIRQSRRTGAANLSDVSEQISLRHDVDIPVCVTLYKTD